MRQHIFYALFMYYFCHFEFTKAVQAKLHFQLDDDAHITSVQLIFLQKRGIKQSLKTQLFSVAYCHFVGMRIVNVTILSHKVISKLDINSLRSFSSDDH
ncbi:hypothetical protein T4D_2973 [Trichinella pseudospiralis]|uniref:Uncharacterized protein n=1 Tax=Trichinella pseudospiralis TaxID=6337 RepID=A0A0V1G1I6_TRIPS|nr:hypothetical protein T4D_2973 [Trichinella pseudospiralis]